MLHSNSHEKAAAEFYFGSKGCRFSSCPHGRINLAAYRPPASHSLVSREDVALLQASQLPR